MSDIEESSGFELRHSLRVLRHRRWVVVGVTVLVVTVALVFTLLQTPKYDASAEIVFVTSTATALSPTANGQSLDPARDIQTEIEVMVSNPIRDMVKAALHPPNGPTVSVTPVTGTNAIRITAESPDPTAAAKIANQYADTYLAYKHTQLANSLQAADRVIQSRIAGLQSQIDALNAQIAGTPPAQLATVQSGLSPQRDSLIAQQTALQQQLDQSQVDAALSDAGVQIGDRAAVPSSPASPRPLKSAVYALVLGLSMGVALALLIEYLDDTVQSKEEAERAAYGVDALGLIPTVSGWKRKAQPMLVSLGAPASAAAEAFRGLRTAINFLAYDSSLRLLLVTSPGSGDGKTTTVANLAIAFGDTGRRVCVVSADLRRPRIHEFFGLPNDFGLTSIVAGTATLYEALQPVSDNIDFLASGASPLKPAELLASRRTKDLLADLMVRYDIVLLDSPPVLPVTDASVLSGLAEGVLLVTQAGLTRKRALTRATDVLNQVSAPIIGLVVNGAEDEVRYGYSSDYYHPPKSAPRDDRRRMPGPLRTSWSSAADRP